MPRSDYRNTFPDLVRGIVSNQVYSRSEDDGEQECNVCGAIVSNIRLHEDNAHPDISRPPQDTYDFLAASTMEVRTGLTVNGNIRHSRGALESSGYVAGTTGYSLDAETGMAEFNDDVTINGALDIDGQFDVSGVATFTNSVTIDNDNIWLSIITGNDGALRLRDDTNVSGAVTSYVRYEASDGLADAFVGLVSGALRVQNQVSGEDIELWTNSTVRGYVRSDGDFEWLGDVQFTDAATSFVVGDSATPGAAKVEVYRAANGFALEVYNTQDLGTNGPDGIVVELGNDTDDPGTDDRFIVFRRGDSTVKGGITGDGNGDVRFDGLRALDTGLPNNTIASTRHALWYDTSDGSIGYQT